MRLDDLIDGFEVVDMGNLFPDMDIRLATADSRKVVSGSAFFAIAGEKHDGHEYIDQALDNGATVIIQTRPLNPEKVGSFIRVEDTRSAYALACARIQGMPGSRLRVIGVTGTNGKTSTVLIARHLLNSAGHRCAALGTLGLLLPDSEDPVRRGLTTPDAAEIQEMLSELVEMGATHLLMEVSSHAIDQGRICGIEFAGAVFTNLTQDHFDYHGTYDHYRQAKERLFTQHLDDSGGYAVINADDPAGLALQAKCPGVVVTFGESADRNLVLSSIDTDVHGTSGKIIIKNGVWPETLNLDTNLLQFNSVMVGRHNAFNCCAAAGIALLEGLNLKHVQDGFKSFSGVPGRLERIEGKPGVTCLVDYAHTPDALINALTAVRELRKGDQRVITVIGCGGDRDRSKRPLMGGAAMKLSDVVVFTSDNPRSEDPESIIDEIMEGVDETAKLVIRESDRRKAIEAAMEEAREGDIVLVAGKGHEDYQILGETTIHFSDAEEIRRIGTELAAI